MALSILARGIVAGGGAAVVLGGAALLPGRTGAQAPPDGTRPVVTCAVTVDRAAVGQSITIVGANVQTIDLAGQLAEALGRPREEVERALDRAGRDVSSSVAATVSVAPLAAGGGMPAVRAGQRLEDAATRLGVTVEELTRAIEAASPCPPSGVQRKPSAAGAVTVVQFDPEAHFEAIATHLGRGITGEQVRAALESGAAPQAGVAVTSFSIAPGPFLEALARELGISVEQLEAALRRIQPRRP